MTRGAYSYFQTHDGARLRYKFWPAFHPEAYFLGTVVLFQGRASFIEKFDAVIESLTRRGFHVWAFDWRGQGLSTRLLKDRRRGHIDSYETYLADVDQLMSEVILPIAKGPLVFLGQSMGSHLALRYLERHPELADLIVLTAPMFELNTGGYKPSFARFFAKTMCRIGLGEAFVIGHSTYDPVNEPFEGNMLTHDREAFCTHRDLQRANPDLVVGGVTYSWAWASFQSIEYLNRPEILSRVKTPALIITAGNETVVENKNVPEIVSWLPNATLLTYEGARHQLLSESAVYMDRFWQDFMAFYEKHRPDFKKNDLTKRRLIKTPQLARVKRIYPTLPNDFNCLQADL